RCEERPPRALPQTPLARRPAHGVAYEAGQAETMMRAGGYQRDATGATVQIPLASRLTRYTSSRAPLRRASTRMSQERLGANAAVARPHATALRRSANCRTVVRLVRSHPCAVASNVASACRAATEPRVDEVVHPAANAATPHIVMVHRCIAVSSARQSDAPFTFGLLEKLRRRPQGRGVASSACRIRTTAKVTAFAHRARPPRPSDRLPSRATSGAIPRATSPPLCRHDTAPRPPESQGASASAAPLARRGRRRRHRAGSAGCRR